MQNKHLRIRLFAKYQAIKDHGECNQLIFHLPKILIPVANGSTGAMSVTTLC